MTHVVQLALLTPDLERVLVGGAAGRWLMPSLRAPKSSRLPHQIASLLDTLHAPAQLLTLSNGIYDPRHDELHRLAVAVLHAAPRTTTSAHVWTSIHDVTVRNGLLPHQRGFLPHLRRLVSAARDSSQADWLRWPDDLRAFLKRSHLCDNSHDDRDVTFRVHRLAPKRLVCEVGRSHGPAIFVYAGQPDGYDEAHVAERMWAAGDSIVPPVIAHDAERRWWATYAIAGSTADQRPPARGCHGVGFAVGYFQGRSQSQLASLEAAGVPRLSASWLHQAIVAMTDLDLEQIHRLASRLEDVGWEEEMCLVHIDPHPGNFICADSGAITLLDLERCAMVPARVGFALLDHFLRRAAPDWYDAAELRRGFLAGAQAAHASWSAAVTNPLPRGAASLIELGVAARLGAMHLAARDLIGTRALMRRTLGHRVATCLGESDVALEMDRWMAG